MTREPDRFEELDLNLNDSVWVRVTAVGEQIYRQHWTALRMDPIPLRRDADGWTMFQLWELAHVFGAAMYNGGPVPVETSIRVRALASPAAAPAAEITQEQLRADLERAAPGADELAVELRKQFRIDPATEYGKHVVARSVSGTPSEPVAPSLRADYEKSLSMPIDGGKQALDRVDVVLAKHAPSLLPRVLGVLLNEADGYGPNPREGKLRVLAAELRRYIATAERKPDPCQRCGKLGGHGVDFSFDGIAMSSWICPHCLDAKEKRIAELEKHNEHLSLLVKDLTAKLRGRAAP